MENHLHKCIACGLESDITHQPFLQISAHTLDSQHHGDFDYDDTVTFKLEGNPVSLLACPKCGTVKFVNKSATLEHKQRQY